MIGGYLPETAYLATFIPELAPAWLDRVASGWGVAPPRRTPQQAFRYCELGCGHGRTINLLGATCPYGEFLGIDVLEQHTSSAEAFANDAGVRNVGFQALGFEEALDRPFRPFDYIVAHGIYSWVDSASREHLLNFAERHLKPGGLFYLSYNALPGWNAWVPLQKLLLAAAEKVDGDPEARFSRAVQLIDQMHEADARFMKGNPALTRFQQLRKRRPQAYLLHEYLTTAWTPFYASDVLQTLAERSMSFVGTADQAVQRDDFVLRKRQRKLLAAEPDSGLRMLMRDIFLDTGFRKDLFTRSSRALDSDMVFEAKASQHYALNPCADTEELRLSTPAGTLRFDNLAARELLRMLELKPGTACDAAASCPDATLADFVNTADALWAADIIRPVDPKMQTNDLETVNEALERLADQEDLMRLTAIPHGTALPARPRE